MPRSEEPAWNAGDPQNWSTWWESWYQIGNAKPVKCSHSGRSESEAAIKADDELNEALKKVVDLGLQVDAKCWTVKVRSRTQVQRWPEANEKEYVTAYWGGVLQKVAKALAERGSQ